MMTSDKLSVGGIYGPEIKNNIGHQVEELRDIGLIDNGSTSGLPWNQSARRAKQETRTALVLAPAFGGMSVAGALATRVSRDGPVFFNHERLDEATFDEDGNINSILKIITTKNISLPLGYVGQVGVKADHDRTPIGKILSRLSADEAPQLGLVVMRAMAVVGPRPMTLEELTSPQMLEAVGGNPEAVIDLIMAYSSLVKGLTGLHVVNGHRTLSDDIESWRTWAACIKIMEAYSSPELDDYIKKQTVLSFLGLKQKSGPDAPIPRSTETAADEFSNVWFNRAA